MKRTLIFLLHLIPIMGLSLLSSCEKGSDSSYGGSKDEPIVNTEAVLMFSNYSTATLLQGINGHGASICETIISDKQPTATISQAWGAKCNFFKSPIEENKWHCIITVPENDEIVQRHAILSIHNANKTIKIKLSQNTHANVESGWHKIYTTVTSEGYNECDSHADDASNAISVVADTEDVTSGEICSECNGTLLCQSCYMNPGTGECKYCKGRGTWYEMIWTYASKEYCNACDWTGQCTYCVGSGICPTCYGLGIIDNSWKN